MKPLSNRPVSRWWLAFALLLLCVISSQYGRLWGLTEAFMAVDRANADRQELLTKVARQRLDYNRSQLFPSAPANVKSRAALAINGDLISCLSVPVDEK